MEFGELVLTRRSVRKFKDQPVEWGKIVEILHAGRLAPNAGNVQNWKFVVVQDETQKKKIADCCDGEEWIASAPAIIVVLGEPEKTERMYGSRGRFLYTIQNCACAAMSMIYAAHDQGLGACWVGSFDEDKLSSALVLPENVFPHVIIPIGYADEKPELQPKSRIEQVTFFERYWNRRKLATPHGQWSRNVMKWSRKAKKDIEEFGSKVEEHVKKKVGEIKGKIGR
ncbi:nitroreductase family protein [Candidatus Woesearchaeota archaeon]|nr:nitroreductase family protein [Candidatus Woesearchaeota archaeon]